MALNPEHLNEQTTIVAPEENITTSFPPSVSLPRRGSPSPMAILSIISHGDENTTSSGRRYLDIPRPRSPQLVQTLSPSPTSNKRLRLPIAETSPMRPSPDLFDELEEDAEDPPRKKKWKAPTGHRRGLSVTEMVSLDAPTRPRRRPYNDPHAVLATHSATAHGAEAASPMSASSTASAESPFTLSMPRPSRGSASGSVASDDSSGDDLVDIEESRGLGHADTAAEKRRQNTIAARRSRQRKLQYVRELESRVQSLTSERDILVAKIEKLEERNEIFRELLTGNAAKPSLGTTRSNGQNDVADVKNDLSASS